jgi:ribonuclease-3
MGREYREKQLAFLQRYGIPITAEALDLIDEALTHSSYAFEQQLSFNSERLEFLGDAVIGLLAAEHFFREHERASEGELSKRKGRIVSRTVLGRRAREMGVAEIIRLGRGEEQSGGRQRPVLLGSTLEALVGAIYLSMGWEPASEFVRTHIVQPVDRSLQNDVLADHKSRFQEIVQKNHQTVPEYRVVRQVGPDHDKRFLVEVRVQGKKLGEGWGTRKKTAENEAARNALERMGQSAVKV